MPTSTTMLHYPDDIESFLPRSDWDVYSRVLKAAKARGIPFAMSGGFTFSFYTGLWRNTKDMDLCVQPHDREAAIEATREAGLHDLYDEKPYDREWIYRSTIDGIIVDIIWQHANYRAKVDEDWVLRGPEVTIYGETLRLIAAEELIWSKVFVVQRERCDWPDIVNTLYSAGASMDWERLIGRFQRDEPLLASVLLLFGWLAPGRARTFPEWIWPRLGIHRPEAGPECDHDHVRLLDSRPWFSAT